MTDNLDKIESDFQKLKKKIRKWNYINVGVSALMLIINLVLLLIAIGEK